MWPGQERLGWLGRAGIKRPAVLEETASHLEVGRGHLGVLRDAAGEGTGVSDAVCLGQSRGDRGDPQSPCLKEDDEQAAASGKVFLGQREHVLLLRSKDKRDECSLIAVADMELGKEPFNVIEIEGDGRTPLLVLCRILPRHGQLQADRHHPRVVRLAQDQIRADGDQRTLGGGEAIASERYIDDRGKVRHAEISNSSDDDRVKLRLIERDNLLSGDFEFGENWRDGFHLIGTVT